MGLETIDPLVEAGDVGQELTHFLLDEMGLLAHAHVAQQRLDDLDREHEQGGRHDHHPGARGALHHVLEMLMQIGEDRFGRHEHEGRVLRLAGDQVFFRNGLDVDAEISAEAGLGLTQFLGGGSRAQALPAFERECGVDDQRRRTIGHDHDAIGTRAIGERRLEGIGIGGKAIGDDGFHPPLPEGATRLLVGEDRLQRDDFGRQRRNRGLGAVDDGEAFMQLAQALVGAGPSLLQGLSDALGG